MYDKISNVVDIDVLVHERRNSIANALELRLSCTHVDFECVVPWIKLFILCQSMTFCFI